MYNMLRLGRNIRNNKILSQGKEIMGQKEKSLIQHILKLSEEIYNMLMPGFKLEWLALDLTVAQLRVLLVLHTEGPSRMSSIASATGTALSTATGIVDHLVEKGLVLRDADPQDRRVVICKLSPEGQEMTNRLWTFGQFQIEKLLDGLTVEQLQKAVEVTEFLHSNAARQSI
jgi:DNA-binding MarR family transcriptional regulator